MRKKNISSPSDYRILVLDDEKSIVDSLVVILGKTGYEFSGLTNPLEAIEKIRNEHYDILILDYMMGVINGDRVVEEIREFNKDIYILLLTGYKDMAPPIETLKMLDIQGYCEKSDRFDQLILMLESGIKSVSQVRTIKKAHKEIEGLYKLLKDNYQNQLDKNENLEFIVSKRTAEIRNLLDHTGQGVLTFGRDLLVDKEYSAECIRIFGHDIEDMDICGLIHKNDAEQRNFLETILKTLFEERDKYKAEVFIRLMPDEVVLNNRNINISYKRILDSDSNRQELFMLILTDITEKRVLESKMEEEKNILKMVVKVVVNYNEFMDLVKDYRAFYNSELQSILNRKSKAYDAIYEVYRNIHTFKASFAQLGLIHVVKKLHDFETKISDMQKHAGGNQINNIKDFFHEHNITDWIDEDFTILKDILGERFFQNESIIHIDKHKLLEVEEQIAKTFSEAECEIILPLLKNLRYKLLSDLMRSYPEYTVRLAERLNKSVKNFEIIGGQILVDPENFNGFIKSLIHVFRNAVVHGIEYPEERLVKGKEEYGDIYCKVTCTGNSILITIGDDGCGLNMEKIIKNATRKRIIDESYASSLSNEEAAGLIFDDAFTTMESVDELAGRGVGLAAVKYELNKMGGKYWVSTEEGKGTEFNFALPI